MLAPVFLAMQVRWTDRITGLEDDIMLKAWTCNNMQAYKHIAKITDCIIDVILSKR